MSRFFRNVSDSESDSDSSSTDSYFSDSDATHSSEDESEDERVSTPTAKGGSNWFMKGASDSDSEDEVKRVVKSAKDKRIEELEASYKTIENALKINDWAAVSNEYEKMLKVISKINANSEKIPNSYLQILITIEDGFGDIKDKKKLNSANAKALNVLKQKVKKNNKLYEKRIEALRNGQEEEEEETPVELPTKTKAKTVHIVDEDDIEDGFTTVGKSGKTIEVSSETLPKKLREVIQARGKKNTDKNEQIQILGKLLAVANTPYFQIKVLFALISARFDYSSGLATHMTTEMWRSTSQSIHTLFSILEINPEISIDESYEEIDDVDGEPDANVDRNKIQGSIVSFIEQLDDEFTKSLQNLDPHATEYIERLADETPLVTIIIRAQRYFESKKQVYNTTRTVIRRIEHTYYKPDHVITTVEKLVYENLSKQSETKIVAPETTPEELVRDLCIFLYKNAEPLLRTRAMLCHIYSVALHGHYYDARDMLLMSHLQETIHQADVTTQVLFNRTMVQIGLSAFKEGLIRESLSCLQELHNTGRVKELLAQGTSNVRHGQNPDQDKLDRQRQIPFHMHINCELVECVFLTCSMLLEVPAMASAGTNPEAKKRIISKPFRRLLDYSDRQIFHGPPENTRDHIMAASHALAAGEWERSRDFMWDIKIWNLLPEPEKIKAMLASKIQEEALRTYLFTYAPYYSTISMSQLGQMFDLPSTRVYSLISKLIWSEELNAGLDQVRNMVVLHAKDPSTIQRLALNLADKTSSLVEGNEKIFELKVSDPSAHLSWSKNTRRTQPNRAKN